jgi:protein-tyrosine-phosphatase
VADVPDLDKVQVIVALCQEGQKAFPKRPAKTLGIDWFVPDPSKARGAAAEIRAAYEATYRLLSDHIDDLVQAILEDPNNEQTPLQ